MMYIWSLILWISLRRGVVSSGAREIERRLDSTCCHRRQGVSSIMIWHHFTTVCSHRIMNHRSTRTLDRGEREDLRIRSHNFVPTRNQYSGAMVCRTFGRSMTHIRGYASSARLNSLEYLLFLATRPRSYNLASQWV